MTQANSNQLGSSKWEKQGICGLVDDPGRGRRPLLMERTKPAVWRPVKKVEKSPRSLKTVISEYRNRRWGLSDSIDTLKLICKAKQVLMWKRVRSI